jgi:tetratricopeptide (TPR) repeat protein
MAALVSPPFAVATFPPHMIHDAALGDADEPTGERASIGVELISRLPRADEDVLGDLAGGVVAERAPADRVDQCSVRVVHLPKRRLTGSKRDSERIGVVTQSRVGHAPMVSVASRMPRTASGTQSGWDRPRVIGHGNTGDTSNGARMDASERRKCLHGQGSALILILVIADPTAIPETADDATEYEQELQAVGGDWPKVEPLARALSQSDVATREQRAMAFSALGNSLENTDRGDEAIDAYRRAVEMGDASAQVMVDALVAKEQRGSVEESHIPQNEAEAGEYIRLAGAAREAGDWERADQLYSAVHQSPANSAEQRGQAALGIGVSLRHRNEGDAAMQYLQEASQIGDDSVRAYALEQIREIRMSDGNTDLGTEVTSSATIDSEEAAATMLQAGVDRYEVSDNDGARARFEAVHASTAASAAQKGYAAYYLATLAWYSGDYDVSRVQFREARDNADSSTADLARQMLQTHWAE